MTLFFCFFCCLFLKREKCKDNLFDSQLANKKKVAKLTYSKGNNGKLVRYMFPAMLKKETVK